MNGKFDRCQLGQYEQLDKIEKLSAEIQKAVRERVGKQAIKPVDKPVELPPQHVEELVAACMKFLEMPESEEVMRNAQGHMLFAAQTEPVIGCILRKAGFKAITKCTVGFDTAQACERVVFAFGPVHALTLDCLRTSLGCCGAGCCTCGFFMC